MSQVESKQAQALAPLANTKSNLKDFQLGISSIIYQVHIAKDGDAWYALIGQDLQNGIAGFGDTVQAALHDLAEKIAG